MDVLHVRRDWLGSITQVALKQQKILIGCLMATLQELWVPIFALFPNGISLGNNSLNPRDHPERDRAYCKAIKNPPYPREGHTPAHSGLTMIGIRQAYIGTNQRQFKL